MKKIGATILLSLSLLTSNSQNFNWIKFNWVGDSISHRYFGKTAIDIPIQIENLPYKFTAQFDLGASNSMIYGNAIAPYLATDKNLQNKIDTSLKTWIDSKQYPTFKGLSLKLGNVAFSKINLGYYKSYGDSLTADSVKSNTIKEIGSIGSDFFRDKVLIIDYPNQRICVTDAIPNGFEKNFHFIDLKYTDGAILIRVQIGDNKENLLFDTGSSLFALITNEKSANEISGENTAISDSLKIQAWGKLSYIYGKKVNEDVRMGNAIMPPTLVYYEKKAWDYFFISHHIWGITGNTYFLNNIIILDFKNQKFGVSNPVK